MSRFIDAEPRYVDADSLKQKWLFRGKDGKPYRDEIDAMPTADVAPVVHGTWVRTGQSFFKADKFICYSCSVCGFDIEKTKYQYCPHCGARMDGDHGKKN